MKTPLGVGLAKPIMSRYGHCASLDESAVQAISESAEAVQTSLRKGQVVYGQFSQF